MKRIFFEVLQESDINDVKKNFLLEQIFEVIFEPSPTITFEELKVGKKTLDILKSN